MKKIVSCLLLLALLVTAAAAAEAEQPQQTQPALRDLQNTFPQGAYWNHLAQEGHGYENYAHYGDECGDVENTYTWTRCAVHGGTAVPGEYDCNCFNGAQQCCGFAQKLAYTVYGGSCLDWQQYGLSEALSVVKPGDVIHYYGGGANARWGHWVFVIGCSDAGVTVGECNWSDLCQITWTRTLDLRAVASATLYSAPSPLDTSGAPAVIGIATAGMTKLHVGDTVQWTASVLPADAAEQTLCWTAGDPSVATVGQDGTVTALKPGKCDVLIVAANGVRKTVTVTVMPETDVNIPVTGIDTAGRTELRVGETVRWTAEVTPAEAGEKFLWWDAGNPGVATVDQSGRIRAHRAGKCNISITAKNGVQKIVCVTVK